MAMSKKAGLDFQLYAITAESNHPGRSLVDVMEQTLIGGAGIVQLRNKTGTREEVLEQAKALRILTRKYNVPFLINDYADIVLEIDAEGVHLGQEDMPIAEARRLLGQERIIGISTHNLQQAKAAERDGADYIGVGPVFPTNTKPGRPAVTTSYVAEAARHISIPFVAIGGISPSNVNAVLAAGAKRICAVSSIVGSDDPAEVCRSFLRQINSAAFGYKSITVNGQQEQSSARTIDELVVELGQQNKKLVVELNGQIVQRALWAETVLHSGAIVELVHFVGGG
ncbi:thiamine-phosphate pyrophosphorylase [Paenibacillus castaneae]|uniref:thiamine phosphate synthase n=2 Tax=Paenibacillus castaneae TaxID=474957 RepID=UPI001FD5CA69|nr:thiamine phosphate synthase [Paenibacillus castaneae]NIK76918.1 thiamine-phosphate pyrophosphorylase [Paenibacillus castaneae]